MKETAESIINNDLIEEIIQQKTNPLKEEVSSIINKALKMKGLELEDTAVLLNCEDPEELQKLFDAAKKVKDLIYGDRLVLFAPLYISNLCKNECAYCAFRVSNKALRRKALSQEEIKAETTALINQGHKRLLLVSGEAFPKEEGFDYILKSIDTVYSVLSGKGNIRRLNVNVAPLETEQFRQLKEKGIGTYQIFQETYHYNTYQNVHMAGRKRDFFWRLSAIDRAFEAGIDDVGIGVLFGLYDYKFEVMAIMNHVKYLEDKYGVGPHTISVPRMEPAEGAPLTQSPPYPVDDLQFKKIIAVLRLAVPYTGIILSTRESPQMRRDSFALGVSQISAGSRTDPGGYSIDGSAHNCAQFSLGDHRNLDEVINDVVHMGYIPSFCTACYRLGRTGKDFMDLAKPGLIKYHCGPNALSTFMEYLLDYASPETKKAGEKLMEEKINSSTDPKWTNRVKELIEQVKEGKRDCYI